MLEALIFAQTVFYLAVSLAIIVIGVLCAIAAYHLVRITKELEEISRNLRSASSAAGERINDIIDRLSDLPVLSYFLRKQNQNHGKQRKKGRGRQS